MSIVQDRKAESRRINSKRRDSSGVAYEKSEELFRSTLVTTIEIPRPARNDKSADFYFICKTTSSNRTSELWVEFLISI